MDIREIPFTVPGGTGPSTWGQRGIWMALSFLREESHVLNASHVHTVPPGRSVQDVADAIRALVQHHHGLLTRFPHSATDLHQDLAEQGTIRLTVHPAAAGEAVDMATAVCAEAAGRYFRHEDELPARFALVTVDGEARHLAMVFSHLILDGESARVLLQDIELLLDGQALPPVDGTWSPLELARYEQSTKGRAQSAAAMRHWRTELLNCPPSIFDVPMLPAESSRFWRYRMVSPAVAVAAGRIARAHRCSTSAVVLAAVAAMLGHYTGHVRIAIELIASNRWRPRVLRTVAQLTELGIFSVDLDGGSFGDLAGVTWRRALTSYQAAAYDPLDREAEVESAQRLRGVPIDRHVLFNDVRRTDGWPQAQQIAGTEAALTELCAATSVEVVGQWDKLEPKFLFYVRDSEGPATLDLDVDTAFLPAPTARQFLMGLEALLVRAACRDVGLDEVGAVTGIVPAVRGDGWVRADGAGWVRPAEVAKLVAAVPGVARSALFTEPVEPADSVRLVAYLLTTGPGTTLEVVHHRVCSTFEGRTDVMAPHHYVLCGSSPADDSRAAWRSMPVITAGSGRH